MSDLISALQSTGKSYTLPFKDTFIESLWPDLLNILPRQMRFEKLIFLLSALTL